MYLLLVVTILSRKSQNNRSENCDAFVSSMHLHIHCNQITLFQSDLVKSEEGLFQQGNFESLYLSCVNYIVSFICDGTVF